MRSRAAAALTVLGLLAGTGGAIALGAGASTGGVQGGAAIAQYKPGKGCGPQHNPGPGKKCPPPKHSVKAAHKRRGNAGKPKRRKHHRSMACKFRIVGRNLIAVCPIP